MEKSDPQNSLPLPAHPTRRIQLLALIFLCVLLALVLNACEFNIPGQATATPTPTETATPIRKTPTPTPYPLGSTENPLVLAYVSETSDAVIIAKQGELAQQLTVQSGLTFQPKIYASYADLLREMKARKVHLAWMPPMTYLQASQENSAQVILMTNHYGLYLYGVQFLANTASKFQSFYDPLTGQNIGEISQALSQFEGKRPCWVELTSPSGYVVPSGLLFENNVHVLEGVIQQNHSAVVRALYVTGICDFGVTFAISGDPRTASTVTQDLTDVLQRVAIIWVSDPIIPNLNLSVQSDMPDSLRAKVVNAFVNLVKTQEGKNLLSAATNYNIEDLRAVDDGLYDRLRALTHQSGVDLKTLIGK